MDVPREKLGLSSSEYVDILNIKCDPILSGSLRMDKGFFPAYHMHRDSWITILLDGTVPAKDIFPLLDMSYEITKKYADENVRMSHVMRLQLLKTYDAKPIGMELLKARGVNAVRGPRRMPDSLIHEIEMMYHA